LRRRGKRGGKGRKKDEVESVNTTSYHTFPLSFFSKRKEERKEKERRKREEEKGTGRENVVDAPSLYLSLLNPLTQGEKKRKRKKKKRRKKERGPQLLFLILF